MAVASVGKLMGRCFTCKETKEFSSERSVATPKNKSTEIHVGSCLTCGKKVSTIVKRKVDQTTDSTVTITNNINSKGSKKAKKAKKSHKEEEPVEPAKSPEEQ